MSAKIILKAENKLDIFTFHANHVSFVSVSALNSILSDVA